MNGYRARRLSEMIEEKEKVGPADFNRMQMDVFCFPAGDFIQRLENVASPDPKIERMLSRLRHWDLRLTTDSVAGSIYEVVRYTLVHNLMEPVLGVELTNHLLGLAFNPILLNDHEFFGYDTVSLLRMLDDPESWWIQQAGGREALIQNSLKQAADYLTGKLGKNEEEWHWGRLHQLTFAHALGAQKPLDKVFNRGPFPIGGDTDTPLQTAMSPDSPYDNKLWSPSVRFIMDMSDLSKCQVVTPVGQSGQLGSPHYDDFIDLYMNGKYHPMLWTREQVESNLEGKLVLEKQ
jgi:penicillin G amidase